MTMTRGTALERWLHFSRLDPATGCKLWTGSDVNREGYARFHVEGRRTLVHRWAFETFVRPLAPGEVIDHLCDTPLCSQPLHLKPCAAQRENVLRSATSLSAVNARKDECVNGHPFDEANTIWWTQKGHPARKCRACKNRRQREYTARLRQVLV